MHAQHEKTLYSAAVKGINEFMGRDYKAPHANRPPRKVRRRRGMIVHRPVFGGRV